MAIIWSKSLTTVQRSKLQSQFKADIEKVLGDSPYTWLVTHAYRSNQEQGKLYQKYLAGGPKAAPPGKSAHNFGLAVDVVLDEDPNKPGVQPSWNTRLAGWLWLFVAIKRHPRLKSGVSFNDACHIERYKWKDHV